MRSEKEIRELLELMKQTYKSGSRISHVESPADAYNSAETLKWVLGEASLIDELLTH